MICLSFVVVVGSGLVGAVVAVDSVVVAVVGVVGAVAAVAVSADNLKAEISTCASAVHDDIHDHNMYNTMP